MARKIVTDEEYLQALQQRALNGTLGAMEPVLWYFAFGKPKERVEVVDSRREVLASLSNEELAERAAALAELIRGLKAPLQPEIEVSSVTVPEDDQRKQLVRLLAEQAGLSREPDDSEHNQEISTDF